MPSLHWLASPSRKKLFECDGRFGPGMPARPNDWEANCPARALGAPARESAAIAVRSSARRAIAASPRDHGRARLSMAGRQLFDSTTDVSSADAPLPEK